MKSLYTLCGLLLCALTMHAQVDKYSLQDLHPVSPSAFQFMKYTELPVSEHTGIPNISVPIYNIKVDEVSIPIQLTYHSQGIRTSQEASWVGLGWDLAFGSIIQHINDRDDYGFDNLGNYVRRRPDYFAAGGDGGPYRLPLRNLDPQAGISSLDWSNPFPIQEPQAKQGYAISTSQYIPVNGQFNMPEPGMYIDRRVDSEPDIFVASFLGETIKFIREFTPTGVCIVLNKEGYKVSKLSNGFKIITPAGTKYFFETKSEILSTSSGQNIDGPIGSGYELSSNIFYLSKIETSKGKSIIFNYTSTQEFTSYPSMSQKLQLLHDGVTNTNTTLHGNGNYHFFNQDVRNPNNAWTGVHSITSTSKEHYYFLSNITFPDGSVQFETSDRNDLIGGKKLDAVKMKNTDAQVVQSWNLNYSYFDASSVGGSGYGDPVLNSQSSSLLRLKLTQVIQPDGGVYNFSYNNTPLPKKNSLAQDYWGFYNGQLSNTSLVPNPNQVGFPSLVSCQSKIVG